MGQIEVICGPMFAGKTEALIGRLTEASNKGAHVQIFKPVLDNRYAEVVIMSHNSNSLPALPVRKAKDILSKINYCDVVGIDEVQFFDDSILAVCNKLSKSGSIKDPSLRSCVCIRGIKG